MDKYFVYALVDPRDAQPFYIGKGYGNRPEHHIQEWRSRKWENVPKCAKIDEIVSAGYEVGIINLKTGLTETGAYRLERELIGAIGLKNLTNQRPGTRSTADINAIKANQMLGRLKSRQEFLKGKGGSLFLGLLYDRMVLELKIVAGLVEFKDLSHAQ